MNWMTLTALLVAVGFVIGAIAVPAWVYVLMPAFSPGSSIRSITGKAMFIIQQLTFGAGVLYERAVGGYEMFAADIDSDQNSHIIVDGDERVIDRDAAGWSRLGWAPFTVSWERTENALKRFAVSEEELPDAAGEETLEEGTIQYLDEKRGGYPLFRWIGNPLADDREAVTDGGESRLWNIRLDAVAEYLGRRAGGPGLADRAEEQALKEHGSGNSLSGKWRAIGMVLCLTLGIATVYMGVMMG